MKLLEYLRGKKTYIAALVTALFGVLIAFDVVTYTPEQTTALSLLLTAILGTTIRLGIQNK